MAAKACQFVPRTAVVWPGDAASAAPIRDRPRYQAPQATQYGRRLRGPERLTPKQFNQRLRGEGIGIKTDSMKDLLRIPAKSRGSAYPSDR